MSLEARLEWRSPIAAHIDRLVIEPTALQDDARLLAAGEGLHHTEEVSLDAAPWCQPAGLALLELAAADVRPGLKPMVDRFYPRAAFAKLPGSARDLRPLKLIAVNAETATLRVDPNHPLAETPARLNLRRSPYPAAPGVRLADLFSGPGMQVPAADPVATYFAGDAFARGDERGDAAFYAVPRLTQHLDANCRVASADFHSRLLLPGMRVLDLMASCDSHLPAAPADLLVCGLGMNAEELAANPRLGARVVQDLNACPALPWPDATFDSVQCVASIEYLLRPAEVIADVLRVLRPGGIFSVSFSDRWFPTKAIRIWGELHPFERLGLVLSLLRKAGFSELQTETLRGVQRPHDDKYISRRNVADPLFTVWGWRSDTHVQ